MKRYYGLSKKIANALLLFPVLLSLGCANLTETLFTEEKYVLIDVPVAEKYVDVRGRYGTAYTIPEKKPIRKIRIFAEGRVTGLRIYVHRQDGTFGDWKLVKDIKQKVTFPIDVSMVAYTDTVAILKTRAVVAAPEGWKISGEIHKVEFYTVSSGN